MEVLVDAKLRYKADGVLKNYLELNIKFKDPYKKFIKTVTRDVMLADAWWIGKENGYEHYHEFQYEVIYWLENKERVKEIVIDKVKKYFNGNDKEVKTKRNNAKIKSLLKDNEKLSITVKIE